LHSDVLAELDVRDAAFGDEAAQLGILLLVEGAG